MIENLFVFTPVRTRWSAVGFYAAWLFMSLIVVFALCFVLAAFFGNSALQVSFYIGVIVAVIVSGTLTHLIAKQKEIPQSLQLTLLAILLAVIGGGLFGLIIPAYLTTRPVHTASAE